MAKPYLYVFARSAEKTTFSGVAQSVSSINHTGPFDILPNHAHFLTLISKEVLIKQIKGPDIKIPISGAALLRVVDGQVDIFLGFGPQDALLVKDKKTVATA